MAWSFHPSVSAGLAQSITTSFRLQQPVRVLGVPLPPKEYAQFVEDTLQLGEKDKANKKLINRRLSETLHLPCNMPPAIAADNAFDMNETMAGLCRYLGVDPVRFLLASSSGKAHLVDGEKKIIFTMKRAFSRQIAKGEISHLDIQVWLERGIHWRGNQLTISRTILPQAVQEMLAGKELTEIFSHPWTGWEKIMIQKTSRRGDSLVITTDASNLLSSTKSLRMAGKGGRPQRR